MLLQYEAVWAGVLPQKDSYLYRDVTQQIQKKDLQLLYKYLNTLMNVYHKAEGEKTNSITST
jgi:pyrroloquinoline quinone (PQQ) biosynthesis protein C